jgi:hypothetical protein
MSRAVSASVRHVNRLGRDSDTPEQGTDNGDHDSTVRVCRGTGIARSDSELSALAARDGADVEATFAVEYPEPAAPDGAPLVRTASGAAADEPHSVVNAIGTPPVAYERKGTYGRDRRRQWNTQRHPGGHRIGPVAGVRAVATPVAVTFLRAHSCSAGYRRLGRVERNLPPTRVEQNRGERS